MQCVGPKNSGSFDCIVRAIREHMFVWYAPISVRWTQHGLDKAQRLGFTRDDIEAAVLERHHERRRNTGHARWQLVVGRRVIIYDHPDGDDALVARIVSVWRRR